MKTNLFVVPILLGSIVLFAENVDPYNTGAQFGWSENAGWMNFEPSQGPGIHVEDDTLTGFVWAEYLLMCL